VFKKILTVLSIILGLAVTIVGAILSRKSLEGIIPISPDPKPDPKRATHESLDAVQATSTELGQSIDASIGTGGNIEQSASGIKETIRDTEAGIDSALDLLK